MTTPFLHLFCLERPDLLCQAELAAHSYPDNYLKPDESRKLLLGAQIV